MKRMWIGIALLGLILAMGLGTVWALDRVQKPIGETLLRAAEQAEAGRWENARALCAEAQNRWEKYWHFGAAVASHEPMEQIDALFAELEVYCRTEAPEAFRAACHRLSRMTQAVSEAHKLNWWNLL